MELPVFVVHCERIRKRAAYQLRFPINDQLINRIKELPHATRKWVALDFASGNSSYGAFSFGGSYSFSVNTSVILAYVIYNNSNINGINNQVTTQLDINF